MKSATYKKIIGVSLLVFSVSAVAENITVSNPTSTELSSGKLLCEYENGSDSYSYTTDKSSCDYSHTFDTNNAD